MYHVSTFHGLIKGHVSELQGDAVRLSCAIATGSVRCPIQCNSQFREFGSAGCRFFCPYPMQRPEMLIQGMLSLSLPFDCHAKRSEMRSFCRSEFHWGGDSEQGRDITTNQHCSEEGSIQFHFSERTSPHSLVNHQIHKLTKLRRCLKWTHSILKRDLSV
jgi:hypothetical protein